MIYETFERCEKEDGERCVCYRHLDQQCTSHNLSVANSMLSRHREVKEENVHFENVLLLVLRAENNFVGARKVWPIFIVGPADEIEKVVHVGEGNEQTEVDLRK